MTPTERYNRFVVFDHLTRQLVRVGSGIDKVYKENNKNLQPRVGIAWDPFGYGKTSVRAAYALLTDQPVTNVVTPLRSKPPSSTPLTSAGSGTDTNPVLVAGAAGHAPANGDPHFDNAYVQSENLNGQRESGRDLAVTIAYFGTKGTHLRISRNINQP